MLFISCIMYLYIDEFQYINLSRRQKHVIIITAIQNLILTHSNILNYHIASKTFKMNRNIHSMAKLDKIKIHKSQ